jgi:hypothetical protein
MFRFIALLFTSATATGDIAFDDALASSTYSAGNMIGSPENAAERALSAGSGYWCSAGSHEAGEVVTWSGRIPAARSIKGVEVSWVHAPKEVRVLTSPDGSNFEEALCWKPTGKDAESFTETLLFSRDMRAKVVSIAMRSARGSGFFGVGEVSMLSAAAEPVMLMNGATSEQELCLVTENGNSAHAGALVTLEACSSALAAGDGRELWKMTGAGQLESVVGGKCVVLGGNSPVGGGVVELADCQSSAETGDGRSFWSLTPSAQLSMARGGGYCMVLSGSVPSVGQDVAGAATVTASAGQVGGESFWASEPSEGPVSLTLDLSELTRVTAVQIDWKSAAKSFKVQIAGKDEPWVTFASIEGNALSSNTLRGATALAKKVRIMMTEAGTASSRYAISGIRVLAAPLKMGVMDCAQASQTGDARDKFFVQQVAEFDPKASAPVRSAAPLLSSAIRDLGVITADLVESFPKLEACRASLLDQGAGEHNSTAQWAPAAALVAASRASSAGASADDSAIQVRSFTES